MKLKINQLLSKAFKLLLLIRLPYFTKNILIVRLDNIGDYILFRNGLASIKNSKKFKGYKFTLLGNRVYKDIAESFDDDIIDHFIWIDPNILKITSKKLLLLLKLKLKAFHTIISPVHYRFLHIDLLIKYINAKFRFASKGDPRQPANSEQSLSDSCYTDLIDVIDASNFEFYRNVDFIKNLTNEFNTHIKFELPSTKQELYNFTKIIIVIVPGASAEFRRWSTNNFSDLIKKLNITYSNRCIFYLTGSRNEIQLGEQICEKYPNDNLAIENLIGKTTLLETIKLINNCNLLISNETGTVHIGAAVKTPVVCISNGNDFGRFNPYPKKIAENIITLYPNENFSKKENYLSNVEKYHVSDLNINDISIQTVFEAAITLLVPPGKTV